MQTRPDSTCWKRCRLIAPAVLLCAAIAGTAVLPASDETATRANPAADASPSSSGAASQGAPIIESRTEPSGRTKAAALRSSGEPSIEELRKAYPFRSLADRLAHEARLPEDRSEPVLTDSAAERLAAEESRKMPIASLRRRSLEMLHSETAAEFVRSPGFGVSRILQRQPSPDYLPIPPNEPIPLATVPNPNSADVASEVVLLPNGNDPDEANPLRLPTATRLTRFHFDSRSNFLQDAMFGYVKDRQQVAGFVPHRFLSRPELGNPSSAQPPAGPLGQVPPSDLEALVARVRSFKAAANERPREPRREKWLLTRLELVSLLKHETPRVYVSDHLPRLDDVEHLDAIETRGVDEIEARGLERLVAGEDLATSATGNVIRMVGSLRASRRCLECHDVRRGELLGAFSYELRRDPPIRVPKTAAAPAT